MSESKLNFLKTSRKNTKRKTSSPRHFLMSSKTTRRTSLHSLTSVTRVSSLWEAFISKTKLARTRVLWKISDLVRNSSFSHHLEETLLSPLKKCHIETSKSSTHKLLKQFGNRTKSEKFLRNKRGWCRKNLQREEPRRLRFPKDMSAMSCTSVLTETSLRTICIRWSMITPWQSRLAKKWSTRRIRKNSRVITKTMAKCPDTSTSTTSNEKMLPSGKLSRKRDRRFLLVLGLCLKKKD